MVHSATVELHTLSEIMEAIQITGIVSLTCVAFISILYGELMILKRQLPRLSIDDIVGGSNAPHFFMEKDKLKVIVRNLKLLVDALESEVYSDVESYTSRLEQTLPPLPDYDEVFEDDE